MTGLKRAARAAFFVVFVVLALSGRAMTSAAADAVCADQHMSVGHEIHGWLVHQPDIVVKKFVGTDAQTGIAIYNRLPPPGSDSGDTFYIAFNPHSPQAYLAITRGDCIVSNGMWPAMLGIEIEQAIIKARGTSS